MGLNFINKILIPLIIIVITGIVIQAFVFYKIANTMVTDTVSDQLQQMSGAVSKQISVWVDNTFLMMEDWASENQLVQVLNDPVHTDAAAVRLKGLTSRYSWLKTVSLVDIDKNITVASGATWINDPFELYSFFTDALSGKNTISEGLRQGENGELFFVMAVPVKRFDNVAGVLLAEISMDFIEQSFIAPYNTVNTGYAFLYNRSTGAPVVHPDPSILLNIKASDFSWGHQLITDKPELIEYTYQDVHKIVALNPVKLTQWVVAISIPVLEIVAPVKKDVYPLVVTGVVVFMLMTVAIVLFIRRSVLTPVKRVVEFTDRLRSGDLSYRLPLDRKIICSDITGCGKDDCRFSEEKSSIDESFLKCDFLKNRKIDFKGLNVFEEMALCMNFFGENLNQKVLIANKIANGDFRSEVSIESDKDILGKALSRILNVFNSTAEKLRISGKQISLGADRISMFSKRLSSGAKDQSVSLDKIKRDISELEIKSNKNNQSVITAKELFKSAMDAADRGALQMMNMMAGMDAISESSNAIAKIISTIDGIAFQTNLLALNASVEAARAGKHGKGFGVVAQEVRNLASRSAKAAQETADLIDNSVRKVIDGSETAVKTAGILEEIVQNFNRVSEIVRAIESMSNEQTIGMERISNMLKKIEDITKENYGTAEETSLAGDELLEQAMKIEGILQQYKLKQPVEKKSRLMIATGLTEKKTGRHNQAVWEQSGINEAAVIKSDTGKKDK